jgi:hypothetical protein
MGHDRRLDLGGVIFGLIILGVGAYYLLRNTFGIQIPEIDWDMLWPLLVVALGVGIVWRAWDRGRAQN